MDFGLSLCETEPMPRKTLPSASWMDPRLTTKRSPIEGGGVFATAPIGAGEVLVRWGGHVYTTQDVLDGKTNDQTACQIDDDLYIASPPGTELKNEDLMNHSCDPNAWMDDETTVSARRDIQPGEEITADYALWVAYPNYVTIPRCRCGTRLCRGTITGDDWQWKDLQERYRGHFPPYLERRISGNGS